MDLPTLQQVHDGTRDVRNRFFILVFKKNLDSIRNEFGSVRFKKKFSIRIL